MSEPSSPEALTKHPDLLALESCAGEAVRLLKMLASEQRLIVLSRLVSSEASVGELAAHAGLSLSAASQHLAKLRAEGLVATRRDAQTVYYRLANPAAGKVIALLCELYRTGGDGQRSARL